MWNSLEVIKLSKIIVLRLQQSIINIKVNVVYSVDCVSGATVATNIKCIASIAKYY